ncbi:MAG TPA: methyltransferase domain-containing protein [Pirellulales bacterium]|nr:methyltransferase domain-containing protein [Pirellulales bacterium]
MSSSGSPDCSAHRGWPWRKRIASAAGRRLRAWWRKLNTSDPRQSIETAVGSLKRAITPNGLADRPGAPACPGLAAAVLPSLLTFGQVDSARCLTTWLLATQRPDGSFPQAGGDVASLFNTSQAVAALLELEGSNIAVPSDAVHRAAAYLDVRLEADAARDDAGRRAQAAIWISVAPSLVAAARRFDVLKWQRTAERMVVRARNSVDWHSWTGSSRLLAQAVDAWIALGEVELAADALSWPAGRQKRSGAVAGDDAGSWGDNGLLGHLALLWYRLDERQRADRAMAFLATQQRAGGGWNQYWGRRANASESAWVAKYYLDAAWLRCASSFDQASSRLPHTIDLRDGRFAAVHEWLAALGGLPKVADLGCGSGRFLRELAPQFPAVRLVGIDPSTALLDQVPVRVETRRGGLLRIPAGDGEFDGAFAVESLEHSLLPERAVSEMCRVVRPGGRVLIIDKHAARQALSLHEPWEQWFSPETVAAWLAPHCCDVRVRSIHHGAGNEPGLFLCWEGTKAA